MGLSAQERAFRRRVDEVLHYLWDPLRVAGVPQARDEYESYVPEVVKLLRQDNDSSGDALAAYLRTLSTEHMGVGHNPEHDREVIDVLQEWKAGWVEREIAFANGHPDESDGA